MLAPLSPTWTQALRRLLRHKGELWQWQIGECLSQTHPGLESHFYLVGSPEQLWANVCVSLSGQVGILGHVYVDPSRRGQGLARALLQQAVEGRDQQRLYLGCRPELEPLYAQVGFTRLSSGFMRRGQQPPPLSPHSRIERQSLTWRHWPLLVEWGAGQSEPKCLEGPVLTMLRTDPQAWVEVADGQVVNWSAAQGPGLGGASPESGRLTHNSKGTRS
ncbi:GNAT family N-acetyltransferase [bacterium]|nr:GNAT family N-acetyltransferase [bacterium]